MMRSDSTQDTLATRAGALFEQFRAGDEAVMGDLLALVTPILWHTVRAQNVDHTSSEDVVQSTWFALVRAADSVADPRAVLQWLIVTAKREAWRVARTDRRAEPKDFEDDAIVTTADASPESMVVRGASNDALWGHISQLPQRCRELLRVIAFADRPDYSAIAESLGMPVGSIGPTRGRCLAKLRAQLDADPHWEI